MALHLFDKPEPGPNLDEFLEQGQFWDAAPRPDVYNEHPDKIVWLYTVFDHTEKGPDAAQAYVYGNQLAPLWDLWLDACDAARNDEEFYSGDMLFEHLGEALEKMQNLRDDGYHFDGDFTYKLTEEEVR